MYLKLAVEEGVITFHGNYPSRLDLRSWIGAFLARCRFVICRGRKRWKHEMLKVSL